VLITLVLADEMIPSLEGRGQCPYNLENIKSTCKFKIVTRVLHHGN
jgi:hypothetical protein